MMDQKKTQEINKSEDFSNLNENHLSIQLSLDGFSFCILDQKESSIEKLKQFSFKDHSPTPEKLLKNVKDLFAQEKDLQKRYRSVLISHVNQLSALVPKPLFDETKMKDYIRYSSKTYDHDYIVYDEIINHDMINVYIPFVNVNNFFLERFGSFEYKHFSTILITTLLHTFKFSEHPHMFAHLAEKHFEIVIIANNKLLLYNSYTYESKEDFIYYILFTAEQLGLNPENFELILSGSIVKESELFKMAYTYVRKVSLLENRSKFKFPAHIDEDAKRKHLTLLNQY
jgi:hypothetical protein